jgi:hypothetical protein
MTEAPPPVPDRILERYALGELPPDQSEAIRARLQAEAEAVRAGLTPKGDLSARLEALQNDDAAILAAHPPRQVAAEIRRRQHLRKAEADQASRAGGSRRWILGVLGPVAAAAIALIVILPKLDDHPSPIRDPDVIEQTTAKGVVSLQLYRDNGQPQGEKLEHGASVRSGDVIQLAYTAGNMRHGVIVSIDGRGSVTLHHPTEPGGSTELSLEGEHKLGFSGELDDAPRYERYFMVTSDKPIDVQRVLDAAARLASTGDAGGHDLPLPTNLEQLSVRIDKESR